MGRVGITYEEVAKAIVRLQKDGIKPTVSDIRAILGTGSRTTILGHLRAWKNSREGQESVMDNGQEKELHNEITLLKERLLRTERENVRLVDIITKLRTEVEKLINEMKESAGAQILPYPLNRTKVINYVKRIT